MDDVRWFAPNRYCTLPVPLLRRAGLRVATDGAAPARLAIASDGKNAVEAFEYAARHRTPLVLYIWDLPPWWVGRGRPDLIFFAWGRIRRVPRIVGSYGRRAGFFSRIRYVARRALQVWVPSHQTQRDVGTRFEVSSEVVPFCYDSDRFRAAAQDPTAPRGSVPAILSISRLVPHKNHAIVLRAAARLSRPVTVRIIGQGPEAGPLRDLARHLGVELDLTDTWASDDDIVAAYRAATVVVSPSKFEGLGLTPLEGLALRRPVVASDIPPHREFAGDAVQYFGPDDEVILAERLAAILEHPTAPPPPPYLSRLSIEACAERFGTRITAILAGLP